MLAQLDELVPLQAGGAVCGAAGHVRVAAVREVVLDTFEKRLHRAAVLTV